MNIARRHSRGFTLMELIIALGITVMIGAVLAGAMHTSFKAKESTERALKAARGLDAIGEILSSDLASAVPPTGIFASGFQGGSESILFYAAGGESRAVLPGDIRKIELFLSDDPLQSNMLLRRVNTNLTPADAEATAPDEPLCRYVTKFQLEYSDGTQWLEGWDSTAHQDADNLDSLPLAVRITLEITPPEEPMRRMVKVVNLPCAQPSMGVTPFGGGM